MPSKVKPDLIINKNKLEDGFAIQFDTFINNKTYSTLLFLYVVHISSLEKLLTHK